MKKMSKKLSAALVAISLMVGAVSYPTKEANAGVVLMSIGGVAGDGTGAIILPVGVSIAMIFGGLSLVGITSYIFLTDINPGDMKKAAIAFSLLTLDKNSSEESVQSELRNRLMISYKSMNMNENDADYLAQIIMKKTANTQVAANSGVEVLFTDEEISQVVNSIAENNPELAQKITNDFTKSSI